MHTAKTAKPSDPGVVNLADYAAGSTDPVLADLIVEAAAALPNVDGRPSVLRDLPSDLFVEGRDEFSLEGVTQLGEVGFGRPTSQQWARCNPEPGRHCRVYCIKEKGVGGRLFPITQGLMAKHQKLANEAKLYLVRHACIWDSGDHSGDQQLMWACPLPGRREASSDRAHRSAQLKSLEAWVQMRWSGSTFVFDIPANPERFGPPNFGDRPFSELMRHAVADLMISDETHDWVRDFLGL
jgi:hypothetical protein